MPLQRIRKLGDRDEVVSVVLSEEQIGKKMDESAELRDRIDAMQQKIKDVTASLKARLNVLKCDEKEARSAATSGRLDVEVHIEEWLTQGNQVIRVDSSTGDQIGQPRSARPNELQEDMFPDDVQ